MPLAAPEEPKVYTTIYNQFKGVDFTNDPTQVYKRRSPDAVNFTPDDGGIPYKRVGWKTVYEPMSQLDEIPIREMWSFEYADKQHLLYVRGNKMYAYGNDTNPLLTFESEDSNVVAIFFNAMSGGAFYVLADNKLMEYTVVELSGSKTFQFAEVDAYVPTVMISRDPSGGGTLYESVNLLTRKRKESFLGDDTSKDYFTTTPIKSQTEIVKVKNESGEYVTLKRNTDYTVNYELGKITFTTAKPPVVTGEDNVLIEYTSDQAYAAADSLKNCTVAAVYNNKIFLTGASGTYKSYVWYCQYEDATYWVDTNYFVVGDDFTKIMGLIDLGEYLGVVKESTPQSSTIFLAYPLTFDETSTYAIRQSITGVGALSKKSFQSLDGEQLFLSDDGIYGISAVMTGDDETAWGSTAVKNRSYFINRKMLEEPNLEKSISVVWNGFYILCVNSHCYLLDSTQKNSWATTKTNLQYECYYWENIPATAFCVHDTELWFGTADGRLCKFKDASKDGNSAFNDDGMPISCHWSTIMDNDGATQYFKNLQKKGCLVTIQSMNRSTQNTSCEVYIKYDDNDPVYIGAIAAQQVAVPQDFYTKKKIKKYKRLQFIVRNDLIDESFGIQEIVKLYTMGNYSKNKVTDEILVYTLIVDKNDDLYVSGVDVENLKLELADDGNLYYLGDDEVLP